MLAAIINTIRLKNLKLLNVVCGKEMPIDVPRMNAKVICSVNSIVILAIIVLVY